MPVTGKFVESGLLNGMDPIQDTVRDRALNNV
jgi:hypothetical protein